MSCDELYVADDTWTQLDLTFVGWAETVQLDVVRTVLSDGLSKHLELNNLLHEVFARVMSTSLGGGVSFRKLRDKKEFYSERSDFKKARSLKKKKDRDTASKAKHAFMTEE